MCVHPRKLVSVRHSNDAAYEARDPVNLADPPLLLPAMNWVGQVLLAVAFCVTGMLCSVQAQRVQARVRSAAGCDEYAIGAVANMVMSVVTVLIVLIILAVPTHLRSRFGHLVVDREQRRSVLPWVVAFGVLFFLGNMVFFDGLVNVQTMYSKMYAAIMTKKKKRVSRNGGRTWWIR